MLKYMLIMLMLRPDGSVEQLPVPKDKVFDSVKACVLTQEEIVAKRNPVFERGVAALDCVPVWAWEL